MIQRILVVDDSSIARSIIKRILEINGLQDIEIKEATNGREALNILKEAEHDLVLTDLNMPDMNGEELLKRIKSSPKLNELPVIIISSLGNPAKEKKLIAEHAEAVFTKPLSLPDFSQFLTEFIHKRTG